MTFVSDHVSALDARLDRLQLSGLPSATNTNSWSQSTLTQEDVHNPVISSRLETLQDLIRSISTTTSSKFTISSARDLVETLQSAQFSTQCSTCQRYTVDYHRQAVAEDAPEPTYEHELEWFLIGKAATQTYGLLLESLISQTVPLSNELWYWKDVLSSYQYTGLYSLQTSPLRFWDWSKTIYHEVHLRGGVRTDGWRKFYTLVKTVIRDRSVADMQRRVATPLTLIRSEVRKKHASLEKARVLNASGIGYLLSNTFDDESLHVADPDGKNSIKTYYQKNSWKSTIVKSIAVMDAVINAAADSELANDEFEGAVTSYMHEDPFEDYHAPFTENRSSATLAMLLRPSDASDRLQLLLTKHLPLFANKSDTLLSKSSRPSLLIRYWLPATLLLVSSSTILRITVNRKAEIMQWVRELGSTVIDFWANWVIEPTRKIIGTIRHDEKSEVSIMSKQSLAGDRASLERMVVDFAVDNHTGGPMSQAEIADVRAKIQEGDLTSVLRVYEKELQSPLRGSITGSLIRALLIQVQKTKVDVEVAMGGIDALLKSQELVFGFVGLTPGILVLFGTFRWVTNWPKSRRDLRRGKEQSQAYAILRNIDRILTGSPQSDPGMLSFKEYGLLVCEAIVLRDVAGKTFPRSVFKEFLDDFDDLIDNESGVGRQVRVADRMRWAYAKWL